MIKIQTDNFSLKQISDSGQCFRMREEKDGNYSIIAQGQYLLAGQQGDEIVFHCSEEEYDATWCDYFDLKGDYKKYIDSISEEDTYLINAAGFGSGIRILKQDVWEMIITFIISQQNNIKRIRKCIDTICEKYGEERINESGIRFYAFPTPEALAEVSEEEFKACNLGYRSKYLVKTVGMIASGEFRINDLDKLPYKEAKQELMKLTGIGSKVADCICLFALHMLDAFPIDTHILKVLEEEYPQGFPFELYQGYAGVLQQYIFYYDLMKGKLIYEK